MSIHEMEHDPLEILPLELWECIFEKVENAQDWLNLFRATGAFQYDTVLGSKQVQVLFPEVISHTLKYLSKQDIFNCRQVSRKWKESVDSAYENYLLLQFHQRPERIVIDFDFGDSFQIQNFLKNTSSHRGNPFFGRCICISAYDPRYTLPDEITSFWNHEKELLQKFGTHIACLVVYQSGYLTSTEDENEIVQQLREILNLVPNLKCLSIEIATKENVIPDEDNFPSVMLPNLDTLRIPEDFRRFMNNMSNPHTLKRLLLDKHNNQQIISTALNIFPNLEELEGVFHSLDITALKQYKGPLRSLIIHKKNKQDSFSFYEIFQAVRNFSQTLEKLIMNARLADGGVQVNINQSKLKQLQIEWYIGSLNQLLILKSLEKLKIEKYQLYDCNGIDYLFLFEKANFRANVWNFLPNLVTLHFENDVTYLS